MFAGKIDGLRVSFDSQVDVGRLTIEERRLIVEVVEKGFRSREDGMTKLGIEDPTAMMVIAEEKKKESSSNFSQRLI